MSGTLRITACEFPKGHVVARFRSTDDAMQFAAVATQEPGRVIVLTDRAGWVNLVYRNGYTNDVAR